jgi:hypothetical protein
LAPFSLALAGDALGGQWLKLFALLRGAFDFEVLVFS